MVDPDRKKVSERWKKLDRRQKFYLALMLIGLVLMVVGFIIKPYQSEEDKSRDQYIQDCEEQCAGQGGKVVVSGPMSNWSCSCGSSVRIMFNTGGPENVI